MVNASYLPEWISIQSAFSFLLAIAKHRYPEYDGYPGQIDITRPVERGDLPRAITLERIYEGIDSGKPNKQICLIDVDRALLPRFKDGSIRCQGFYKRTLYKILSGDPNSGNYSAREYTHISENYEDIGRTSWRLTDSLIDYLNGSIFLSEENDPFIVRKKTEDISDQYQDTDFSDFTLEEEMTDIEVSSKDLLEAFEDIFDEYCAITNSKKDLDSASEISKPTGKERFFYSSSNARWLIEFEGKVFFLTYKETDKTPLTIHYLINKAQDEVKWSELVHPYKTNVMEETSSEDIDLTNAVEIYDQLIANFHESPLEIADKQYIDEVLEEIKTLRESLSTATEDEKASIMWKLSHFNKFMTDSTFRKKIKKDNKQFSTMVNTNKARITRFREKVEKIEAGKDFAAHLEKTIASRTSGAIYQSGRQWQLSE